MANFTNFTKLQLIVDRTDLGTDGIVGGDYIVTITIPAGEQPTSDTTPHTILGINYQPSSAMTLDGKLDALAAAIHTSSVGLTASKVNQQVVVVYDLDHLTTPYTGTIPTDFTTPIGGINYVFDIQDQRDVVTTMKHSEYEDSESGLKLATEAMYSLVAASAKSDTVQLQRIMLSDSDVELVTTDITGKVVGKDYQNYSVQ